MGLPAFSTPVLTRLSARATTRLATVAAGLTVVLAVSLGAVVPAAQADNPPTPGAFTGYGFDQCNAPTQAAMDAWWRSSPFKAAGIYISGDSRACTAQPNLSPTWVAQQLATGWKLLPITLGPQASCTTRAKYLQQVRINPLSTGDYAAARTQGSQEAAKTVAAASALGITPGSTMYYDLEAFSITNVACRDSAMAFLSGWTLQLHAQGYVSGAYSSAASGIKVIDAGRAAPTRFTVPDQLWIADWNGVASSHTSYIPDDGWAGQRIHQYQGGHNETWGGVTINIDSNWVELGGVAVTRSAASCGSVKKLVRLAPGSRHKYAIKVLQCRLQVAGMYGGKVTGKYNKKTVAAVKTYRASVGYPVKRKDWTARAWRSLLARG